MSITITRRLEIDAGHRLMNHESKCRNVHGHRYVFEFTLAPDAGLDNVGRVVDFGVVRTEVGRWLDETFDHGMIVQEGDPMMAALLALDMKTVVLDCAPSIENLCEVVFKAAFDILKPHGVQLLSVRGFETPNCWADYRPTDERPEP